MKDFKTKITAILVVLIIWGVFAWFIIGPLLFLPDPITTYECPCELSQLKTDVVRHTNKDGIETVTTYIEIKDCIQSNNN